MKNMPLFLIHIVTTSQAGHFAAGKLMGIQVDLEVQFSFVFDYSCVCIASLKSQSDKNIAIDTVFKY